MDGVPIKLYNATPSKKGGPMFNISSPKQNQVVPLNEPFTVYGSVTGTFLYEVTIQVDQGPARPANLDPVNVPKGQTPVVYLFIGWGQVTSGPGSHVVTATAIYHEGGQVSTAKTTVTVKVE
jgi:hypothetical protein